MPNHPAIPLRGARPRGAGLDKTLPAHEHASRRTRAQAIKKLPAVPGPRRQPKLAAFTK